MSWHKVDVKVGTENISGMLNANMLQIASVENLGEAITVNGKNHKIESFMVDHRDDIFKIILAEESPTKEKSDDKQTKRED